MYAVFGDGHEYDWALEGEEGMEVDEEDAPLKQEVTMAEVRWPWRNCVLTISGLRAFRNGCSLQDAGGRNHS
jgi:hypothetical protein